MRVAVTGASGRLGSALVSALADAPFTGPGRADRLEPARASTSMRRRASRPRSTATGPRSSSTSRPGPTSTAAPATRTSRCAGTGPRPASSPGPAPARGIDLVAVSTNEVFDGTRTDGVGYGPDDAPCAGQPLRRLEAAGGARRGRARIAGAAAARASGSPGRLAVRAAGQRLPAQDPRRRGPRGGRRRAAPRRRRRVGHARPTPRDVADAIVELLAEDAHRRRPPPRQRADRHAGRLGPRRRRPARAARSGSWTSPPRPGSARRRPPRWGVLAPTPLPSGEPLRPWPDAMADYAPALACARQAAGSR